MSFGIRVKLFAGFGAVLFLFAVVAGCGLVKLGESDDSVGVLGAREMPSLQAAMNSQVAVVSVQRDLHQAVLVNDDAARAKSKASYEASDKQFAASVAELGKLLVTPEGKASLAEVTKAYADWAPTRTKALDLALKGDAKGAEEALFSDQNVKAVSTINAAIDNLVKLKQTRAQAILAEANAASDQARMLMIALSMIAGVLGFGVAFFMVRSIASAVSVVAASAQRIAREDLPSFVSVAKALAAGDLTQEVFVTATRVDVRSKDELGRMADDFNAMIDGLQETGSAFRQMTENLRALVGQVQSSANLLADTSGQLGAAANQTGAAVQQVNQAMQNVAAGAQDTSRGAQETNASVGQLTQAIDQISRGAAEQAHQVQAASATATEMAAGVEQVAANATRVAAASEQTKTAAQQGSKAVKQQRVAIPGLSKGALVETNLGRGNRLTPQVEVEQRHQAQRVGIDGLEINPTQPVTPGPERNPALQQGRFQQQLMLARWAEPTMKSRRAESRVDLGRLAAAWTARRRSSEALTTLR